MCKEKRKDLKKSIFPLNEMFSYYEWIFNFFLNKILKIRPENF